MATDRKHDVKNLPALPRLPFNTFFVNHVDGVVHWVADLDDESVVLIFLKLPCDNYIHLLVAKGERVGLFDVGFCWEVWAMNEYGVEESWTKLYDTLQVPLASCPLAFLKNKREILFRTSKWKVVSYDPICNRSKILDIGASQACTYMESLVSINAGAYR